MPWAYRVVWKTRPNGNPYQSRERYWVEPKTVKVDASDPKVEAQQALKERRAMLAKPNPKVTPKQLQDARWAAARLSGARRQADAKAAAQRTMWENLRQLTGSTLANIVPPKPGSPGFGRRPAMGPYAARGAGSPPPAPAVKLGPSVSELDPRDEQTLIRKIREKERQTVADAAVKQAAGVRERDKRLADATKPETRFSPHSGRVLENLLLNARHRQEASGGNDLNPDFTAKVLAAYDVYTEHVRKAIEHRNDHLDQFTYKDEKGVLRYKSLDAQNKAKAYMESSGYSKWMKEAKHLWGDSLDQKTGSYNTAWTAFKQIGETQRNYVRDTAKNVFMEGAQSGEDVMQRRQQWEDVEKWLYLASAEDIKETDLGYKYTFYLPGGGKIGGEKRTVEEEFEFRQGQYRAEFNRRMAEVRKQQIQIDNAMRNEQKFLNKGGDSVQTAMNQRDYEAIANSISVLGLTGDVNDVGRDPKLREMVIDDAVATWESRNIRLYRTSLPGVGPYAADGFTPERRAAYFKARDQYRERLYKQFGAEPPAWYEKMFGLPGIKPVTQVLGAAGSLPGTAFRLGIAWTNPGGSRMNLGIQWDRLPPDVQKAAMEAGKQASGGTILDALARAEGGGFQGNVFANASREKYVGNWIETTSEGQKWMRGYAEDLQKTTESQNAAFLREFYGEGKNIWDMLDAVSAFGAEPTTDPMVNLLSQFVLDPTVKLPFNFMTWGMRYAKAMEAARGVNKLMKAPKFLTTFQNLEEPFLRASKFGEPYRARALAGEDPKKLVEEILTDLADAGENAGADAVRKKMRDLGLDKRQVSGEMVLTQVGEALRDEWGKVGVDYEDMLTKATTIEKETARKAAIKAQREARSPLLAGVEASDAAKAAKTKADMEAAEAAVVSRRGRLAERLKRRVDEPVPSRGFTSKTEAAAPLEREVEDVIYAGPPGDRMPPPRRTGGDRGARIGFLTDFASRDVLDDALAAARDTRGDAKFGTRATVVVDDAANGKFVAMADRAGRPEATAFGATPDEALRNLVAHLRADGTGQYKGPTIPAGAVLAPVEVAWAEHLERFPDIRRQSARKQKEIRARFVKRFETEPAASLDTVVEDVVNSEFRATTTTAREMVTEQNPYTGQARAEGRVLAPHSEQSASNMMSNIDGYRSVVVVHDAQFGPGAYFDALRETKVYKDHLAALDEVPLQGARTPDFAARKAAQSERKLRAQKFMFQHARQSVAINLRKEGRVTTEGGNIPWARNAEGQAFTHEGGTLSHRQPIFSRPVVTMSSGAMDAAEEAQVLLEREAVDSIIKTLLSARARLQAVRKTGRGSRVSKGAGEDVLTFEEYLEIVERVSRQGVYRRNKSLSVDMRAGQGSLVELSEMDFIAARRHSDFIAVGEAIVDDMMDYDTLGHYYESFSVLPGMNDGPGYATTLMGEIMTPSWRNALTRSGFASMMRRNIFKTGLPSPAEFRRTGAHLNALFQHMILDDWEAFEFIRNVSDDYATGKITAAEYRAGLKQGLAMSNGGVLKLKGFGQTVRVMYPSDPKNPFLNMWLVLESRAGVHWAEDFLQSEGGFMSALIQTEGSRLHPNMALAMIPYSPLARGIPVTHGFTGHLRALATTQNGLFRPSLPTWTDDVVLANLQMMFHETKGPQAAVTQATQVIHYLMSRYGDTITRKHLTDARKDLSMVRSHATRNAGQNSQKQWQGFRKAYVEMMAEAHLAEHSVEATEAHRAGFASDFDALFTADKPFEKALRQEFPTEVRELYDELYWSGKITHDNAGLHTMAFFERMGNPKYQRGDDYLRYVESYYSHMNRAGDEIDAHVVISEVLKTEIQQTNSESFETLTHMGETAGPLPKVSYGRLRRFLYGNGFLEPMENLIAAGKAREHVTQTYSEEEITRLAETNEHLLDTHELEIGVSEGRRPMFDNATAENIVAWVKDITERITVNKREMLDLEQGSTGLKQAVVEVRDAEEALRVARVEHLEWLHSIPPIQRRAWQGKKAPEVIAAEKALEEAEGVAQAMALWMKEYRRADTAVKEAETELAAMVGKAPAGEIRAQKRYLKELKTFRNTARLEARAGRDVLRAGVPRPDKKVLDAHMDALRDIGRRDKPGEKQPLFGREGVLTYLKRLPASERPWVVLRQREEFLRSQVTAAMNAFTRRLSDMESMPPHIEDEFREIVEMVQGVPDGQALLDGWEMHFRNDLGHSRARDYNKYREFFGWSEAEEAAAKAGGRVDDKGVRLPSDYAEGWFNQREVIGQLESRLSLLDGTLERGWEVVTTSAGGSVRKELSGARRRALEGERARLGRSVEEGRARLDAAPVVDERTLANLRKLYPDMDDAERVAMATRAEGGISDIPAQMAPLMRELDLIQRGLNGEKVYTGGRPFPMWLTKQQKAAARIRLPQVRAQLSNLQAQRKMELESGRAKPGRDQMYSASEYADSVNKVPDAPVAGPPASGSVVSARNAPPGWESNPDYVYVGRAGKGHGGEWGNPFPLKQDTPAERARVIGMYREWILKQPDIRKRLEALRGKTLVCFCAPKACHGDVLRELANWTPEQWREWNVADYAQAVAEDADWRVAQAAQAREYAIRDALREAGPVVEEPEALAATFKASGRFRELPQELIDAAEPSTEFAYHTTPVANLDGIREGGLVPSTKSREDEPAGTYFASSGKELAGLVPRASSEENALLRVRRGDHLESVNIHATNGPAVEYISRDVIAPHEVEFYGSDGKWHPLAAPGGPRGADVPIPEAPPANAGRTRLQQFDDAIETVERGGTAVDPDTGNPIFQGPYDDALKSLRERRDNLGPAGASKVVPRSTDFVPAKTGWNMFDGPFDHPDHYTGGGPSPFFQMNYGGSYRGPMSKIHVAGTAFNGQEILRIVDAISREMGVMYKWVKASSELFDGADFGKGGIQQGKFITAYPDPQIAGEFARRLDEALQNAGIHGGDVAASERRYAPDSPITHRYVPDSGASGERFATDGDYATNPDYIGFRKGSPEHLARDPFAAADEAGRAAAGEGAGPAAPPPGPEIPSGPDPDDLNTEGVSVSQRALEILGGMSEEDYIARELDKAWRVRRLSTDRKVRGDAMTRITELEKASRLIRWSKSKGRTLLGGTKSRFTKSSRVAALVGKRAQAMFAARAIAPLIFAAGGAAVEQGRAYYRIWATSDINDEMVSLVRLGNDPVSDTYKAKGTDIEAALSVPVNEPSLARYGYKSTALSRLTYTELLTGLDQFERSLRDEQFSAWLDEFILTFEKRLQALSGDDTYNLNRWLNDRLQVRGVDHFDPKLFEEVEPEVARAINDMRPGEIRTTKTDLKKAPGEIPPDVKPLSEFVEQDVRAVIGRNKALAARGIDPHAYAEAWKVLRKPLQSKRYALDILRLAKQEASKALYAAGHAVEDDDWDAVFLAEQNRQFILLRQKMADAEALKLLNKLTNAMPGATPRQIIEEFERRYGMDLEIKEFQPTQVTPFQKRTLEEAAKFHLNVKDLNNNGELQVGLAAHDQKPPYNNREAMRKWLVDYGFWSPRTADAIDSGKASWSIQQEDEYFRLSWGAAPEWADVTLLEEGGRLRDAVLFDEVERATLYRNWGLFNRNMKARFASGDMTRGERARFLVEGAADLDVKPKRDLYVERRYVKERFRELAVDKKGNLIAFPELMTPDELTAFIAARGVGNVPERVFQSTYEFNIFRQVAGIHIKRFMEKYPYKGATVTWADYFQLTSAISHDVLLDPIWMSRPKDSLGRFIRLQAAIRRALVFTQIGFLLLNVADTGIKGPWSMFTMRSFRTGTVSDAAAALTIKKMGWDPGGQLLHELGAVGTERMGNAMIRERRLFDVGGTVMEENNLDRALSGAMDLALGFSELPAQGARNAENATKLRLAQQHYDGVLAKFLKDGHEQGVAEALTISFLNKEIGRLWPTAGNGPIESLFNQLSPFASYQFKNRLVFIGELASHPVLFNYFDHIGDVIEKHNREEWAKNHPGEDLPDNLARLIELPWAPGVFIDLGQVSDFQRGFKSVTDLMEGKQTMQSLASQFVRLAGPNDINFVAGWANALDWGQRTGWVQIMDAEGQGTGQWKKVEVPWEAPWGGEADWLNSFWPVELGRQLETTIKGNWNAQELTKLMYQATFFGGLKEYDRGAGLNHFYWALKDKDPTAADEWLNNTDQGRDLRTWWTDKVPRAASGYTPQQVKDILNPPNNTDPNPWLHNQTPEYEALIKRDLEEMRHIRQRWDNQIGNLVYGSKAFSNALMGKQIERWQFINSHPELYDYFAASMSAKEWATQLDEWQVDDLSQTFYNLPKPERKEGESEKDWQKRLAVYFKQREDYLKMFPQVAERIAEARNTTEMVWKAVEDHWFTDILTKIGTTQIAIDAAQQAKNFSLADQLYLMKELQSEGLNEETAITYFDAAIDYKPLTAFDKERGREPGLREGPFGQKLLPRAMIFPDMRAYLYDRADPAKRAKMDRDSKYASAISDVIKKAKASGNFAKSFVLQLKNDKWLREEYFRRNPGKREAWAQTDTYIKYMGKWHSFIEKGDWDGANKYFDSLPTWAQDRYLNKNPKARAGRANQRENLAYMSLMKRWTDFYRHRDYEGGARFFEKLPQWAKDRYYSKHPTGFGRSGGKGSSPYSRAMGKWVKLLQEGDKEGAKKYFDSMPQAYRDRYYSTHPEAKIRDDIKRVGQLGAYFSADDANRVQYLEDNPEFAKWLKKQGNSEQTRRMLIMAAYRGIPSSEQWLKRVYREKYPEIFSKEAAGERARAKVLATLAEHPELTPGFEKWLNIVLSTYAEELKHAKAPPKPLEVVHQRQHGMDRRRPHSGKSAAWVRLHSLS